MNPCALPPLLSGTCVLSPGTKAGPGRVSHGMRSVVVPWWEGAAQWLAWWGAAGGPPSRAARLAQEVARMLLGLIIHSFPRHDWFRAAERS